VTTVLETPPLAPPEPKSKKNNTAHLKAIPETRELRDRIRDAAHAFVKTLDRSKPLIRDDGKRYAEELLKSLNLGEQYMGFALVAVANEFWREQVAAIPFNRRLLLLPHCLKNAEGCPADYDEFGLECKKCGACSIADFRGLADEMGYKVLVAEGSPIVLKIIVSGYVDAIVGVAWLNVLEKAIDKILLAGIPCIAAVATEQRHRHAGNAREQDLVDRLFEHVQARDADDRIDVARHDDLQHDRRAFAHQHLVAELFGLRAEVADVACPALLAVEAELVVVRGAALRVLQAVRKQHEAAVERNGRDLFAPELVREHHHRACTAQSAHLVRQTLLVRLREPTARVCGEVAGVRCGIVRGIEVDEVPRPEALRRDAEKQARGRFPGCAGHHVGVDHRQSVRCGTRPVQDRGSAG
jgi:hypothetical protein